MCYWGDLLNKVTMGRVGMSVGKRLCQIWRVGSFGLCEFKISLADRLCGVRRATVTVSDVSKNNAIFRSVHQLCQRAVDSREMLAAVALVLLLNCLPWPLQCRGGMTVELGVQLHTYTHSLPATRRETQLLLKRCHPSSINMNKRWCCIAFNSWLNFSSVIYWATLEENDFFFFLPSSAWGGPSAPCLSRHTSPELNPPNTPW